jgi:hypothetical protein
VKNVVQDEAVFTGEVYNKGRAEVLRELKFLSL